MPRSIDTLKLLSVQSYLSEEEQKRVAKVAEQWNFYEGYHWEGIQDTGDRPQVTENYCATFVNKFVAFELGKGFTINTKIDLKDKTITDGGATIVDYLNRVWEDNKREQLTLEIGQAKGVNGDMWVQVRFENKEEIDDPFGEYDKGRIRIIPYHKGLIFPEYDPHDKDKLVSLKIMYQITMVSDNVFGIKNTKDVVYKQIWTKDKVQEFHGTDLKQTYDNPYGLIPFVQIKNFPLIGRTDGISDLENLIPLNMEYNLKKSDISEIIDYHASPVTVVFGAKIGNLEKGANKVWGGLPKDAKVENLELASDLGASNKYVEGLKISMNEIGNVPVGALGGEQAISNTSGVALQFVNAPILDRTRIKRTATADGIKEINKLILFISKNQGIITIPDGVSNSDFYNTVVSITDTMPKDMLIELQQIEIEMRLGLEDRKGAMQRVGKEDIDVKIAEIDADREANPSIYGIVEEEDEEIDPNDPNAKPKKKKLLGTNKNNKPSKLNSGLTNGEK